MMKRLTKRELAVEGKVRCVVCGKAIGLSERFMMPVIAEDLMIWVSGACRECFEELSEDKENSPHPALSQRERVANAGTTTNWGPFGPTETVGMDGINRTKQ